jgi:hypothetical protein
MDGGYQNVTQFPELNGTMQVGRPSVRRSSCTANKFDPNKTLADEERKTNLVCASPVDLIGKSS